MRFYPPFIADEAKGKELKFDTHNGYFESNKSGLKGDVSFLAIGDAKTFDGIFGKAATMGPKPNWLPDNAFESKIVLATIQRGMKTVEYKVAKGDFRRRRALPLLFDHEQGERQRDVSFTLDRLGR